LGYGTSIPGNPAIPGESGYNHTITYGSMTWPFLFLSFCMDWQEHPRLERNIERREGNNRMERRRLTGERLHWRSS